MSDWREVSVAELGALFDGPHATPARATDGPYFLNISSLTNGRLDLTYSDHVSDDDFIRWTRRVTPKEGDLLFSYETRLGDAALMPPGIDACLGRRMALLRPDRRIIDPRFLLYLYLGPSFQSTIASHTIHGATVNRIPLSSMPRWKTRIPDMRTQVATAEVLGALDHKIDINARLSSDSFGLVAAHFSEILKKHRAEFKPLRELAEVVLGGTPPRDRPEFWIDGTIPWLNSGKANDDRVLTPSAMITSHALQMSAAKLMPEGATLIAITGATLGQVARLEFSAAGNQSLVGVWADDMDMSNWLHFAIRQEVAQLLQHATGAAQQHVNKQAVASLSVPVVDSEVLGQFSVIAAPLLQAGASALRENQVLAKIRGALLPQLISGKLRIRDAERTVSEVL